jgi:hypothetical protein
MMTLLVVVVVVNSSYSGDLYEQLCENLDSIEQNELIRILAESQPVHRLYVIRKNSDSKHLGMLML